MLNKNFLTIKNLKSRNLKFRREVYVTFSIGFFFLYTYIPVFISANFNLFIKYIDKKTLPKMQSHSVLEFLFFKKYILQIGRILVLLLSV